MAFAGLKKQINKANQVSAQIKNALNSLAAEIGSWTCEKRDGNPRVKIAEK
jgi:phosphoenolpyruvate carboxylase